MRPLIPLLLTFTEAAQADRLVSWQRRLNLTLLEFESGAGEIEIINPSTFRFVRCRSKPCAGRTPATEPVTFRVVDTESAFEFRTSYIEIRVRKHDGGLMVKSRHGVEMLDEIMPPGPAPAGLNFRDARPTENGFTDWGRAPIASSTKARYRHEAAALNFVAGLWPGSQPHPTIRSIRARCPSMLRSGPPRVLFLWTNPEILEENCAVTGGVCHAGSRERPYRPTVPRYANKVDMMPLPDLLAWLSHASMSGLWFRPSNRRSCLRICSTDAMICGGPPSKNAVHDTIYTFDGSQGPRISAVPTDGHAVLKDVEAAARLDQFMLGVSYRGRRQGIYLPMGIWTDMRTGAVHKGKQTFPLAGAGSIYAKNGTIVPLFQPDGTLQLH
jgi:hypothetical protein